MKPIYRKTYSMSVQHERFGMNKKQYQEIFTYMCVCKIVNSDYYYIGLTYNPEQTAQRLEDHRYFPKEYEGNGTVNVFSVYTYTTIDPQVSHVAQAGQTCTGTLQ